MILLCRFLGCAVGVFVGWIGFHDGSGSFFCLIELA